MKIAAYSLLIFSALSARLPNRDSIAKRIDGGPLAELSEFPYIANIDVYDGSGSTGPGSIVAGCGATVITSRHILTAAHCFHSSMSRVFNASNIVVNYANINFYLFTNTENNVKSYTKHPDFNWGDYRKNDIAIIELKEPVDTSVTSFAKIYDLPIVGGSVATPAGWGDMQMPYPGTLEKMNIMISNSSGCLTKNRDWNGNSGYTICIQPDGTSSLGSGDSGGPLSYLNLPGSPQLGVLSFGDTYENSPGENTQTVGVPKELLLYSTEEILKYNQMIHPQPPAHQLQPPAHQPQPPAHHPQPPAHQPLPPAHYPQPQAHNPQPQSQHPQPPAQHPQPPAHQPQPPAQHPQPPAHQPQPPAYQPQPPAHQPQPPAHQPQPPAHHPQPPAHHPQPPAHHPQPPSHQALHQFCIQNDILVYGENGSVRDCTLERKQCGKNSQGLSTCIDKEPSKNTCDSTTILNYNNGTTENCALSYRTCGKHYSEGFACIDRNDLPPRCILDTMLIVNDRKVRDCAHVGQTCGRTPEGNFDCIDI
ncbi:Zinc finger protein [Smittium culicis]|uniref:Zinc finger protein n=1 Tax=Smittium culicis TaxID=133412 RepID=A0A1R1XIH6_9FUNG|nr:Zinc finger protein [Smittium culicis]